MKISLRNIIALLSLLIAIVVYRLALIETYLGWSNSTVQFVLLPIVLISIALISFYGQVFPRFAIFLACLASIGAGIVTFGNKPERLDAAKIYISPFLSDPHEAQSIKFATLLAKTFDRLDLNFDLERISNPIADLQGVGDFLNRRLIEDPDETTIVISGSSRWLSLSTSSKFAPHLVTNSLAQVFSALNIKLVTQVSGTGLSNAFSFATQEYIAWMLASYVAINDGQLDLAEQYLLNAASIVERWTSGHHRAYALWMLGTLYLNKAFNSNSLEPTYLNCSIDYFKRALGFIRKDRNPELYSAVINNLASAHFLSYLFLGHKNLRKQSLKEFKIASRTTFKASNINNPAWLLARENLYSLNRPKNLKQQFARKMRKLKKSQLEKNS